MRVYNLLYFLIYLFPLLLVLFINYSAELLFIVVSNIFIYLLINASIKDKGKAGISFYFKNYTLEILLIICLLIQLPSIIKTFFVLIRGDFFKIGVEIAKSRYDGTYTLSSSDWLSTTILFSASLMLGLNAKKKINRWIVVIYIILLFQSLSGLARASLLINIILLVSGILMKYSYLLSNVSRKKIYIILISSAFFAIVVYAIPQYGRVYDSSNPTEIVLRKTSAYSISIYYAFSEYIKNFEEKIENKGSKTFRIISSVLGEEKYKGMYDPVTIPQGKTNIFTIHRGIIEDFGFLGYPFVLFILYFSSVSSFYQRSKILFIATFWTIPFFLYPFYSIFYFNNVLAGYLIFSIALLNSKIINVK